MRSKKLTLTLIFTGFIALLAILAPSSSCADVATQSKQTIFETPCPEPLQEYIKQHASGKPVCQLFVSQAKGDWHIDADVRIDSGQEIAVPDRYTWLGAVHLEN
jgi:hypothetical protein